METQRNHIHKNNYTHNETPTMHLLTGGIYLPGFESETAFIQEQRESALWYCTKPMLYSQLASRDVFNLSFINISLIKQLIS